MKSKILSLFLILTVVFSCISESTITAFANTDYTEPTIYVESQYAAADSKVNVNINVVNNPGIAGAILTVKYNEKLKLIDASNGEKFSALDYLNPGVFISGCRFSWDSENAVAREDGTMLTLTFEVSPEAIANEELNVDVSYRYGDIYDTDLNSLKFDVVNGSVRVINYIPGDVNDDGFINGKDITIFRRYNAGGHNAVINVMAADVNDDGMINGKDVTLIRRYSAGGYGVILKPSTPKCDHSLEMTEAQASTCTEDGNAAYWYCTKCDKYFNDSDGTSEIKLEDTVIKATGHTPVIDPAVEPTETQTGLTEGAHCAVCYKILEEQQVIPVLEKEQYSITYHIANNDLYLAELEIENNNPTRYATKEGLRLQDLIVPGYVFEGWYDGAGSNGSLVKEIKAGEKGNKVLYAHWTPVNYTINFNSPLAAVESVKYTVDKGATLKNPEWFGYTFVGWSDDEGNLVTKIEKGTTGNITLHANWTSKRNQTIPVKNLGTPIIHEDTENGRYLFAYELGRIENVPLYTIKDFGNTSGITVTETMSTSGSISESSADTIAQMISNATTRSSSWTLSEEWNQSTTVSESHASEVGSERIESANLAFGESGSWNIGSSYGGSTTVTDELGVSAKVHQTTQAKASVDIPLDIGSVEASSEFGWEAGADYSHTKENNKNWNVNKGYEHSANSSVNMGVSQSLSQKISDEYGYSQSTSHGGSESVTSTSESSQTNTREYSSTFAYSTEQTETSTIEYTNAGAPEGYYRLVCAGTIHVFGVVGYDIATSTYFTYTYTVMDDELKKFIDYSKTTPGFDDYENGVLPFEVPYYVNKYIDSIVSESEGMVVDIDTGKVVAFNGEAKNVVVPKYKPVDNGDGTTTVVKITGFESNAFAGNTEIETVKLPDTITEIPASGFEGCTSLRKVNCPSLKKIGDSAFNGCTSLEPYVISPDITELGSHAFVNVPKVTVNAANTSIAEAGVYCGAKSIVINLASLTDTLENKTFTISDTTDYFEFNGANRTYNGLKIISDAAATTINGVTFANTSGVPLKLSSGEVTLNRVTVNAEGIAIILSADYTTLGLYGTVTVNSSGVNAIVSKNVTLCQSNPSAVGKLNVNGNMLVCGAVEGENMITFVEGKIVYISQESYDQLIQDSLEWVLASDVPEGAQIVSEKWTYDETTNITSDQPTVDGYTLYDTTSAWGDYGNWSAWSKTAVSKSDSRQVETKTVVDRAAYTQYRYWRYVNSAGTAAGTKGWNGCTIYQEIYLDYKLNVTDSSKGLYGPALYNGGFSGLKNIWFYGEASTVPAVTHVEYRYRDRKLVYTYYHTKTESKESMVEITESDTISNVKKWVQYVTQ